MGWRSSPGVDLVLVARRGGGGSEVGDVVVRVGMDERSDEERTGLQPHELVSTRTVGSTSLAEEGRGSHAPFLCRPSEEEEEDLVGGGSCSLAGRGDYGMVVRRGSSSCAGAVVSCGLLWYVEDEEAVDVGADLCSFSPSSHQRVLHHGQFNVHLVQLS